VRVTVVITQPGLSKAAMTNALAELLGCTELYLSETYNSRLRVICSAQTVRQPAALHLQEVAQHLVHRRYQARHSVPP
jgi:hypothetical protein